MFNFFKKSRSIQQDPNDPFVIKSEEIKGTLNPDSSAGFTLDKDLKTEVKLGGEEKKQYLGISVSDAKMKIFLILTVALLACLWARSAYLQIGRGDYYYGLAEGNRMRIEAIPSARGIIYDRRGSLLVENVSTFALAIVPIDLPNDNEERDRILRQVSDQFSLDYDGVKTTLQDFPWNYNQNVAVKDELTYDEALRVHLYSTEYPFLKIFADSRRQYPLTQSVESLAHLLGYMGKINEKEFEGVQDTDYLKTDKIGKTGLELSHERDLRGRYGVKKIEIDALGFEKKIISEENEADGTNLFLSIDLELQQRVENILKSQLTALGKAKGVAIVMDPNNGEIFSLVSLPAYDNNLFAGGISQQDYSGLIEDPNRPLFNCSVSGEYPSGSTFKMVVAAAALEEGIITPYTTVLSTGVLTIGRWHFPDWKEGGHGLTDIYKALAESVNTFFYYIGGGFEDFEGLGVEKITEYAQKFGLGDKLGIDLPYEATGFLPNPEWKKETKMESWYIGDTYHYAIGQGDILVTPLQVAVYTSVFANGGILYLPHLVHQTEDPITKKLQVVKSQVMNDQVVSRKNIDVVREGMRLAVSQGSARRLSSLPFSVAGKTGTSEWSSTRDTHAWFTGFAPYNNPEVVVTVLIEEGGEGSEVAVPIAYDIFSTYFNLKNQELNIINLD